MLSTLIHEFRDGALILIKLGFPAFCHKQVNSQNKHPYFNPNPQGTILAYLLYWH